MSEFNESYSKGDIAKIVLLSIGIAGFVVAGAVCPGIAHAIRLTRPSCGRRQIYQAAYRLDKKGWIEAVPRSNGWNVRLTEKGLRAHDLYLSREKVLKTPLTWDGKWRMLLFDIPEKQRMTRYKIRAALLRLGFARCQRSVWIYPYECREVIDLLRVRYGILYQALYVRTEHMDHEEQWKKHFGLA